MIARTVEAETLDHLGPDDPAAQRSRRDLQRVHRVMRTRAILRPVLQQVTAATPSPRVLELGAGDGTLLLGVARDLAKRSPRAPQVELTLLDRQPLLTPQTVAAYAEAGWTATARVADVFQWARDDDAGAADEPPWSLIVAALFLHHFEAPALRRLLGAVAQRCDRFFACEPRRSRFALAGSHLIGALGVNAVTRGDAVLSVRAGFTGFELSALWPAPGWRLDERAVPPFSHVFAARAAGAA